MLATLLSGESYFFASFYSETEVNYQKRWYRKQEYLPQIFRKQKQIYCGKYTKDEGGDYIEIMLTVTPYRMKNQNGYERNGKSRYKYQPFYAPKYPKNYKDEQCDRENSNDRYTDNISVTDLGWR